MNNKLLFEGWRDFLGSLVDKKPRGPEKIPDIATSQDEIQKSVDYFYKEHAPKKGKREELGDWKGNKMVGFKLPDGDIFFFVVNKTNNIPYAYLAVEPFRDGFAVGNVRKVKGGDFYTTELYQWFVDRYGSLYSDKKQTSGGSGIWDKIVNKEKVETDKEDGKGRWRWRLSK